MGVLHPKCDSRFPNSNNTGHCAECCQTFVGLTAFDRHLDHTGGNLYSHLLPEDGVDDWWLDERGSWHWGKRMTKEEKERRFGAAA